MDHGPQKYQRQEDAMPNPAELCQLKHRNLSIIPQVNSAASIRGGETTTYLSEFEQRRKRIHTETNRVLEQVPPMNLQQFKESIAKKCNQVKNDLVLTVKDIKQMAD
jgi:hypothetical protein